MIKESRGSPRLISTIKINEAYMHTAQLIANMGAPGTIWAISAPQGHVTKLNAIHEQIWREFRPGDKIVYMGNYLGNPDTPDNPDVIDSIVLFSNALVGEGLCHHEDIICLKGLREDLWLKLLQLQFSNRPIDVLTWLLNNGMEGMINHYGSTGEEGLSACRSGLIPLIRWTKYLNENMRQRTGHALFYNSLKRAATTSGSSDSLLFVHCGLNPDRPLGAQDENFWWSSDKFETIENRYENFKYIVRGFDPHQRGVITTPATISLNGDHTRNKPVVCAKMRTSGDIDSLYSF